MPNSGKHNSNGVDSFSNTRPSNNSIKEGQSVSYIDRGNLVRLEKRKGVVYESKLVESGKTQTASRRTSTTSISGSGDISAVIAGTGLTGGGTSAAVTLSINSTVTTLTGSQALTNKTLTSPVINTGVSGTAILDENNMASDSDTKLATQQSIKAYVDSEISGIAAPANATITLSPGAGLAAIGDFTTNQSGDETLTIAVDGVLEDLDTLGAAASDGQFIVATGSGAFAYESESTVRTSLGLGTLATLSSISDSQVASDAAIAITKLAASSITVADGSSSTAISLGNTITFSGTSNEVTVGESSGTITVSLPDDVTIAGDLTVNGDVVTITAENLVVQDPLIKLSKDNNSSDSLDIGFYGLYDTSGSQDLYAGLFRDANDSGKFKLFKDLQVEPTTTVDVTETGYAVATLVSNLEGNVTGNVTGNAGTATKLATARDITLTGDITGVTPGAGFDGSAAVSIDATIAANAVEGSMLNTNVISGQTNMTGDVADADELMISDAGTLKRIDFSVLRDAVYNDVSGDATIADGGALTIAVNSVALATDTTGDYVQNITAGAGLASTGATSGENIAHTLTVDISEFSDVQIASGDKVLVLDSDGSTEQLESIDDVATLFAGAGLTASSAVINLDITGFDAIAEGALTEASDVMLVYDADAGVNKKITIEDLEDAISTGGTVTNIVTENGITGGAITTTGTLGLDFSTLTDMTGDIAGTTEFILQNGTVESRKAASEIKLSYFNNNSGWTANAGTVTSVTAGSGMTQSGTSTVNPTLNVIGGTGITANANDIAVDVDGLTLLNEEPASGDTLILYDDDASTVKKVAFSNIVSGGTVNNSNWSGTDLSVANGGTGVSTLADNSVLTGTGTSPITAESTLTFDGSTLALTGDLNVGSGDFFVDDSAGKIGIGTGSPGEKLHVAGSIEFANRKHNVGSVSVAGAGTGNGVAITLNSENGTTLHVNYQYKITLTTLSTGTDTGAVYICTYDQDSTAWSLRMVSRGGSTSNHPLLAISGTTLIAYHNHAGTYPINYFVEAMDMSADDGTLHNWGADYHWQRDVDVLSYSDGDVNIDSGTFYVDVSANRVGLLDTSPDATLQIGSGTDGKLFHTDGLYNDVTFSGGSGGTSGCWEFVNSGTWGQTRFYVQDANNSADRLTFDFRGNGTSNKILAGTSTGLVGIGTNSPLSLLDLGNSVGQKFYLYSNGAVRNGLGIDLSGTSRELSYFHTSSNASDGQHSWGYRLEGDGSYVERMQLTGAGDLTINGGSLYLPVAEKLFFGGGAHTYIGEDIDDRLRFFTGGAEFMRFTESTDNSLNIYEDVYVADDKKIHFGAGNDIKIYHNSSSGNANIENYTGDIYVTNYTDDGDIHFRVDDSTTQITALKIDASAIGKVMLPNDLQYLTFGVGGDGVLYSHSDDFYIGNHTAGKDTIFQNLNSDSSSYVEIMRLDGSTSRVGIGTTAPATKLMVRDDTAGSPTRISISNGGTAQSGTASRLSFYEGTTEKSYIERRRDNSGITAFHTPADDNPFIWTNATGEFMRFTNSNVGIGTTSPARPLVVNGSDDTFLSIVSGASGDGGILFGDSGADYDGQIRYANASHHMFFKTNNVERMRLENDGDLHLTADVVAYSSTPSDIRLKENFTKIDNGLDIINKLDGHTFNWKKDGDRLSAGFKAQEVEKILPHLVDEKKLPLHSDDDKEYKILRYEEIIPYLVEAIKEQQVQIDELKTQIGEQNG